MMKENELAQGAGGGAEVPEAAGGAGPVHGQGERHHFCGQAGARGRTAQGRVGNKKPTQKNPPKKTHPKKPTYKNPQKMAFFGFF